jgi:hypothetical protein
MSKTIQNRRKRGASMEGGQWIPLWPSGLQDHLTHSTRRTGGVLGTRNDETSARSPPTLNVMLLRFVDSFVGVDVDFVFICM